jgi:uncharacterized protein (TIGR03492 family)
MKLLCLSNGHGEDAIALRILQAMQQQPDCPELAALPIVGTGQAYIHHGIPIVGPTQAMPSGGFVYMDGRQLMRDVRGGLLRLTQAQLQTVRDWAKSGGFVLAVGDIVPLLFAWCSGAAYAFVGTARSEYYLRDEQGWLPRRTWFERLEGWAGSVYLPWERWLMQHPRCRAVFPRDSLTASILQRWAIPTFDLGNPMMDGLEPTGLEFGLTTTAAADARPLTFVLLPGSRPPEAYAAGLSMASAGVLGGDRPDAGSEPTPAECCCFWLAIGFKAGNRRVDAAVPDLNSVSISSPVGSIWLQRLPAPG